MYQLATRDAIPGGLAIPNYAQKVNFTSNVQRSLYRPVRILDPEEGLNGLGQESTTQAAEGAGIAVGAAVGQALIPIPGVGAAIGAIGSLIASMFQPNLQKIQASNDANEIEIILQQNLANWLSLSPSQKTVSVQSAAAQVFNAGWTQYMSAVQPDLAKAPNSISDRAAGSCAYHTAQCAGWTSGGQYIPNGPNQATGCCWNWFTGYLDPILNDPDVIPDPVDGSGGSVAGSSDSSDSWLLYAAIGLAALVAFA